MNEKIIKKMRDLMIITYFSQSDIACDVSLWGSDDCAVCKNRKFCEQIASLDNLICEKKQPVNYRDMDRLTEHLRVPGLKEKMEDKMEEMMQRRETVYEIMINDFCPQKDQENQDTLKELFLKSVFDCGWHNIPLQMLLQYLNYCKASIKKGPAGVNNRT